MAKETCTSCEARLLDRASFCPSCARPTRHASDAERLEFDLSQWRAHVDRSVAAGIVPGTALAARVTQASHVRPARIESPVPANLAPPREVPTPPRRAEAPPREVAQLEAPARRRMPRVHVPRPRLPRIVRSEPAAVVDLSTVDHGFVYRACATCERADWILRGRRNDDETWIYWCVRCSRSFKTEMKLRHAFKPFLSAGIVIGGLTAASMLMLR